MLESSKSQTGKLRRTSGQKVKLLHGTSGRSGGSTERFNKFTNDIVKRFSPRRSGERALTARKKQKSI